ncbi:MAG: dehydrogenase [Planctomycetaceae bacterium]|nr:dehydrogenase [Planctomycetaceae bacterium]
MAFPTRRTVLKSLAAAAPAVVATRVAHAAARGARPRLALIGCGVRGRSFYDYVDYVCDPDAERLAAAAQAAGVPSERAVTDMRRLLDDPAVDGVVIAAPDHWHAPAALLALAAGKHAYVEKPCCHNLREGQLLVEAAKRSGLVVQHGTQQRSRRFTADAIQMLHEGKIGDVLAAKAWNIQMRDDIGHLQPSEPPPGVDYDLWVGPAQFVPFQANRFHKNWHWWYNFGTGDIGNDGAHELDYARWGLGVTGLPSRVAAVGGKYFFDDDQQFPDTANCTIEYADAQANGRPKQLIFEMRLWSRNYPMNCDSGVEFYGTDGQMFLSKRGKLRVIDGANKVLLDERAEKESGFAHVENFLAAIRDGATLNAPIEVGYHSVAPVHYANIAIRTGSTLTINPATGVVQDNAAATDLLGRKYRDGGHWSVPAGGVS